MLRNKFYDSLKRILFAFVAMLFIAPAFSAKLPLGYTQLEYLESTGTQYIDTGVKATNNTKVIGNFYINNGFNGQLFGSYDSGKEFRMYVPIESVSSRVFDGASFSPTILPSNFTRNTKLEIKLDKTGIYIGNGTCTYTTTPSSFSATSNIYLGAISAYTSNQKYLEGKIYDFRVYENESLVRDFVPAQTTINGETVNGMYDTVGNQFYRSAASGTNFTAGPAIQTYTMLEYIRATGTQYLDSGRKATNNTDIAVTLKFNNDESTENRVFGNYASTSKAFTLNLASGGTNRYGSESDNGARNYFATGVQTTWANGKSGIKKDDTVLKSWSSQTFETVGNMALLASTNTEEVVPTTITNGVDADVYKIVWKENGNTVMNLVPARRDSDGAVGMLDTVNTVFYENRGTGTFGAGPDLTTGGIKIATTKYNEDAFADLVATLNSAITKVTNVVDTTVAQASSIGTLATTKQDRPADGDCPAGRKCLLVTGTDGKPHWYLIQE